MSTLVTRRNFLAGVGASAAALTAYGGLKAVAKDGADWAALARDLSGHLVRPGEAGYPAARRLFDPRFDGLRPAGIAYCRSPHDVSTCIAFARRYGVPLTARSGGHSYAGWSSTSGLIVDVSAMNSVHVSGGTVTVGAGTRLIDLYSEVTAHGRAIGGGSCPTVGIAGLALGGGVGVVARAYGLTCDNLESVRIVTADGALLDCDASTHPDLYWACRGGGGGNFGIVTEFTFGSHPADDIVLFFLHWPWSLAARVIAAWQYWAPHAPDALWSNLHLTAAPGARTPAIEVGGTYLGSVGDAIAQLDRLYAAAGSTPPKPFIESTSYMHAMLVDAGCADLDVQECHLPWQAPGGRLKRQPQYAKSDFFTRPLSSAAIGTLLRGVENLRGVPGARGGVGAVAFDAMGGAVNRVEPGATAFIHRNALFMAQYTTGWAAGASASGIGNQHAWLRSLWRSVRPHASGQAYQNYIDPDLAGWRQAYYGANYTRLVNVKHAYDPGRLFSFPQAI
jgi:FAD binding domain/Berberine and berberine like